MYYGQLENRELVEVYHKDNEIYPMNGAFHLLSNWALTVDNALEKGRLVSKRFVRPEQYGKHYYRFSKN